MKVVIKIIYICIGVAFAVESGVDLLPGRDACGKHAQERIYGGEEADIGQFPWMALLEYRVGSFKDFVCGGTLINNRYILTAAHCISNAIVSIRLGEHNIKTEEDCEDGDPGISYSSDPPLDIEIEEKIVHKHYNNASHSDDIALLRLKHEINYTDFIKPICLPISPELRNKTHENSTATVCGWGATEKNYESDIKLKVDVPIVPNRSCSKKYKLFSVSITNSQICAGGEKGKSFCNGDSGGPLMYLDRTPNEENWIGIGIVSFGLKWCALQNVPVVYTRIAEYMPWILENLKP